MSVAAPKLRYLIGLDADPGEAGAVTVIGYDAETLPINGVGYMNARKNAPGRDPGVMYLHEDDIEREYGEPAFVFNSLSFWENFDPQVAKWKRLGAAAVEIDNLDTYTVAEALKMFDRVHAAGMGVWVKNAAIVEGDKKRLLEHAVAVGCIVERDCGTPSTYDALRKAAGKPDMPIRFVAYGGGKQWAQQIAGTIQAADYPNMGVTHSDDGEYRSSRDVLLPITKQPTKPMTFADDVLAAMRRRGDPVAVGPDVLNIFYARGIGIDHRPNGNPFDNRFNDLCGLLRVVGDKASIIGEWPCTIDPGKQYVHDRINPDGAAAITPGYYEAWHVGSHPMSRPNHEALVQSAGEVTVYSDDNEDGSTEGDKTRSGYFGINQHGPGTGYGDKLLTDIGPVSAGCLVRPSMPMHREFMWLVKTDARYLANKRHVFGTSIFNARDIVGDSAVPVTSGYRSLIGGFFSNPERTDLPPSIRYNNPGAVNAVAWNKALPGYAGDKNLDGTNTIAIYYTPEQGTAMWWEWMSRARAAGVTTIEGIMVRYGGSSQVAKYREYARTIAGWMGVSPSLEIDIDDDASLLPFAKALFRYEAGRATPLSDAQIIYGFNYARNGFKPPVDEPDEPDDEPVDDDGDHMPDTTDIEAAITACEAKMAKAIDDLRAEVKRIEAKKPPPASSENGFDLNAIPEWLVPAVWPTIQKMSADEVMAMLKKFKEAKASGKSMWQAAILAIGGGLGGASLVTIISEVLSRFGGG